MDYRIQQQDSEKTICSDHEQKKNLSIVMITELRTLIAMARHGTFSAAGDRVHSTAVAGVIECLQGAGVVKAVVNRPRFSRHRPGEWSDIKGANLVFYSTLLQHL
ncbi:hypothetical protein HU811_08570 [Pseudomonas sp. SWRI196]|uniref:Uncharacterized protein n=1 Tax=Pseudomonas tehranensis TaxID=2745502 RepID=A0ABR6UQ75_9PSED|nr:hypothetical protein [Pseudomonas tehranensis]MBC3346681.1 hypothetical protein [Pseudomonas tehranensis]